MLALRKRRPVPYRGLGMTVHGVELTDCTSLQMSGDMSAAYQCAQENQARIDASYSGGQTGSYLGGGVYAGTQAAFEKYGDTAHYTSMADEYQKICGGPVCQYDSRGNIINPTAQVTTPAAPVATPVVKPAATVAVASTPAPSAPAGNGVTSPIPPIQTTIATSSSNWFSESMIGGIPNWVLLGAAAFAVYSFSGRRH